MNETGMAKVRDSALNVAEVKKHLSDLLGRVAYGRETILITRRGRPMARLVPPDHVEEDRGLASVRGWLDDDDPFFATVDSIVAARARRRPRSYGRRRGERR